MGGRSHAGLQERPGVLRGRHGEAAVAAPRRSTRATKSGHADSCKPAAEAEAQIRMRVYLTYYLHSPYFLIFSGEPMSICACRKFPHVAPLRCTAGLTTKPGSKPFFPMSGMFHDLSF